METVYRWMAQNRILAKILCSAFLCGAYTWLLLYCHAPVWAVVAVGLFMILLGCVVVDESSVRLLRMPLKALHDNCDPYPLLCEMREQMDYKYPEIMRQTTLMNYCTALLCIGETQQAWELLSSINIDKCAGMLPLNKVIYYNNLSSALVDLGRLEEASVWHRKMLQILNDIKDSKMKKELEPAVATDIADEHFRKGEYDRALECIRRIQCPNLYIQVETAFLYGKISLAMGDTDTAKQKLEFVVSKGNKLHRVQTARQMLDELIKNEISC